MTDFVKVYVEIEKGSNKKYEWNKSTGRLELDRTLSIIYKYPCAYGFIPNTLAEDGDELDAVLITSRTYKHDTYVFGYVVGVLIMEDEKGMDEKLLVLPIDDYLEGNCEDICDVSPHELKQIEWFFSNYKKDDVGKWSKVFGFEGRARANEIFAKAMDAHKCAVEASFSADGV